MDGARWNDAGLLTGRTTYHLVYDSQEFPWKDGEAPSIVEFASSANDLRRMWTEARRGARAGAVHLAEWVRRWCSDGRSVMLVGFSLGASVVWEAAKLLPDDLRGRVDLVLISGAVVDDPAEWSRVESCSSVTNVWSSSDLVLRWLYPAAVGGMETPAVGLGPIGGSDSVRNVDLTDLIGTDHLWAGRNVTRILRVVLGLRWSGPSSLPRSTPVPTDAFAVERLCGWTISVQEAWDEVGRLLSGSEDVDQEVISGLDRWGSGPNLAPLLHASSTVARLAGPVRRRDVADRSMAQLEGFIRRWMGQGRRV